MSVILACILYQGGELKMKQVLNNFKHFIAMLAFLFGISTAVIVGMLFFVLFMLEH